MEDTHYLYSLLKNNLPQLGLDPDTYIPYVIGYTAVDVVEENDDTLDEVIALLRASSETHTDIDQPWTDLKNDIIRTRNEFKESQRLKQEEEYSTRHHIFLADVSRLDQPIYRDDEEISSRSTLKADKEMDEMKRTLIQKYAYDESVVFDDDGNQVSHNLDDEDVEYINNRQFAQQQHLESMQRLRSVNNQNKKEEREKTKLAKLEKHKQKEDRRLRAQKGERKA